MHFHFKKKHKKFDKEQKKSNFYETMEKHHPII